MGTIFNSSNKYAGFFQAFSGGEAAIRISRATGGNTTVSADAGDGFMVSQYQVRFERGVSTQRFLNMSEIVAMLGIGNGVVELTGLVGSIESFERLLTGSTSGEEDICNQLTIEITPSSSYSKCTDNRTSATSYKGTIRCSGGIVRGIALGGTIDQQGIMMQTGSVTIQFTQLDIDGTSTSSGDMVQNVVSAVTNAAANAILGEPEEDPQ